MRHVPTPRREHLVYEAVSADTGVCPYAAARCAPSMRGRVVSVRDDAHARVLHGGQSRGEEGA